MGTWYSLYPFDEEKFTETVVPSLKRGLADRPDLFDLYKQTRLDHHTNLTTDIIASVASSLDAEFKSYPGYDPFSNDLSTFEKENPWYYEWSALFELVVFHECAYYKPELYCGKFGINSRFTDTSQGSVAYGILGDIANETIHTYYTIGIVNWITNEDVKLLLIDFDNLKRRNNPGDDSEHELYDEDFYNLLLLADKHSLGLLYGADLKEYTIFERQLN
ncbi:hypothetical protein QNI16_02430 [Cytophagaceae bacterium YF14B1]|uniref:Uncharacterized protein n=1 Tax=Xanthocytophaga flava TaxID=3048013 RepID=A0AAE3QKY2_9BACT|nr:hypothetical protein [Xanthocytophaga flavus]MDJ1479323.1 hypothetical protein [Xanthocytophaga flavus]